MKNVSKRLVAAIAAICLGSAIAPFTVGAVTYDPCDVNHDGDVDISDVIVVNQHLSGARYFRNYSQLDANRSHTVDAADANCVMRKVVKGDYSACYIRQYGNGYMQVVNMPAVSSANSLDYSYMNTSARRYIGYSYAKKANIAPYSLTPTLASASTTSSGPARTRIDGTDERTKAHGYENTGIVSIIDANDPISTGFIVGEHMIATAAHCVYIKNNVSKEFKKSLTIKTYNRTGIPENHFLTAVEAHIPEDFLGASEMYYDYALITVKEDLSDYVHFEIGNAYNMTNSEVGTIPIHVTGVPLKTFIEDPVYGEWNDDDVLYTHNGSVYGSDNTKMLRYTVDATGGQSGSPVYTITRERYNNQDYYTYTALAIHSRGMDFAGTANHGALMTQYQLQFYKNNPNAHYQ